MRDAFRRTDFPRDRGARPRADRAGPAARLGRTARAAHAAWHRHHAGPRVSLAAAAERCPAWRVSAAALVRLFGAPHALSGLDHAARRDADRPRAKTSSAPWSPTASAASSSSTATAAMTASIDVLASTLGHRHYGRARIAALTYFHAGAPRRSRSCVESAPGGMGHACEFETSMIQHLRPELVKIDRAETTYPDPGSPYLTTDLHRRLGRARLPRFRGPFADRHARRSVARHARERRRLLRSRGRGARRLHRGLPRLDHPGEPR